MLTVSTCMLVPGGNNQLYIIDGDQDVTTCMNSAPNSQCPIRLIQNESTGNTCFYTISLRQPPV